MQSSLGRSPLPSHEDLEWRSLHIFYHGDRNKVLTCFIAPLVRRLLADQKIESFFFIRYWQGGPHIRLRLLVSPEMASDVEAEALREAVSFLEKWPASDEFGEDTARPSELQPNNTVQVVPFEPETERYGGADLLRHSLDFFAISSIETLRLVATHGGHPWARQLPAIFRLLLRQALGFSRTESELLSTVNYMPTFHEVCSDSIVQQAERVLKRTGAELLAVLQEEIQHRLAASSLEIGEAARRLSFEIAAAHENARQLIGASQMHMTANRTGLKNMEELYLGYLLKKTLEEFSSPDLLTAALANSPTRRENLSDMVVARLRVFAQGRPPR